MGQILKAIFAVLLLGVPVLVIAAVPRLFELAGSVAGPVTTPTSTNTSSSPGFHLQDPTPTGVRRFAPVEEPPPPTLAAPVQAASPIATPRPTATGERIKIGNTGGVGAVLRSDPVTGRPVAALREQQVLDVLERRNIPGSGDWLHVRTTEGVEGWVTGLVALPVVTNR